MGPIDEDLWEILADRLQGRLLQSEKYSDSVEKALNVWGRGIR